MKGEKTRKTVEKAITYYILWDPRACYKFIFHVNGLKEKIKFGAATVIVIHMNFKRISFFDYSLMLMSRKINFRFFILAFEINLSLLQLRDLGYWHA